VRAGYQCATVKYPAARSLWGKAAALRDVLCEGSERKDTGREICTGITSQCVTLLSWRTGAAEMAQFSF